MGGAGLAVLALLMAPFLLGTPWQGFQEEHHAPPSALRIQLEGDAQSVMPQCGAVHNFPVRHGGGEYPAQEVFSLW